MLVPSEDKKLHGGYVPVTKNLQPIAHVLSGTDCVFADLYVDVGRASVD
jgi:hypothetical protein